MKYIFANWKMYLDYNESVVLSEKLASEKFNLEKMNVAVFPTALALKKVSENLSESGIEFGPQDTAWVSKGAYTGGISALMFKDIGCKYALVGHSERRYVFGETDEQVRKKVEACLDAGIIPVVCIGETAEEKELNQRQEKLAKQLCAVFEGLKLNETPVMVAYEPLWAISKSGIGLPCLPEDADDVQGWVKKEIGKYTDQSVAVLYGGSVKAENVLSYLSLETVDGVLVGAASSKIETFEQLLQTVEKM